jgi:protein SCO1
MVFYSTLMSKKALLALSIAILIPLACYLVVRYAGEKAVNMPRHMLLDSVVSRVEDGKLVTDSIWHKTQNITLVNQLGDTVSLYNIQGKIIVADLFFTSCRGICPRLTQNMSKMQQSFLRGGDPRRAPDSSVVQFLSFSIDPQTDSVQRLKDYADKFNANHDSWWFLTGDRKKIYDFVFEELKVDKYSEEPISPDFAHTNRFILIDRDKYVRGYYNGLDSASLKKLAEDIGLLMLEKDPSRKRKLFQRVD